MDFADQVVVVTGGNSGIGRVIAGAFAAAGAVVWIAGRNVARGEIAVAEIQADGGRAYFSSCDLSDLQAVAAMVATMKDRSGKVDVLINNAGAGESRVGSFDAAEADLAALKTRWEQMSGSNFASAFWVSSCVQPLMASGSSIVNITSTASQHGNYGLYGAMKAGLDGLTRSLAVDLAPQGIRVNAVSPGWIQTPATLTDPQSQAQAEWAVNASLLGRMGQASEISDAVMFLASEKASFITGETLVVDGGLSIIDPTAASWREQVRP